MNRTQMKQSGNYSAGDNPTPTNSPSTQQISFPTQYYHLALSDISIKYIAKVTTILHCAKEKFIAGDAIFSQD